MDSDTGLNKGEEVALDDAAYVYLTSKEYPDGCTESRKRCIRKKAKSFEVEDGVMCSPSP